MRNAECGMRNWGAENDHLRRCVSIAALCRRFAFGGAVLLQRFPSVRAWRCGSGGAFCYRSMPLFAVLLSRLPSVHACCLFRNKQDGLRNLAFLFRRVEIAFVRSRSVGAVICLCGFTSGLRVSCRRSRRVTGSMGKRGWRRGACASLRNRIGFEMLSAGSTLRQNVEAALRSPQTASKSRVWKRHCCLSGLSSRCGGLP